MYGKQELVAKQPGVAAMGFAGQMQLGATTYGEFVVDPTNSECVNSHKTRSKEIFSLYCRAYLATKKLEEALLKELGPFPAESPSRRRTDEPMPRDITNFQMVPFNVARTPSARKGRLEMVPEEPPRVEANPQVAGPAALLPWWIQMFNFDVAAWPKPYKWIFVLVCFLLPNLVVHIASSFVKRIIRASAAEASTIVAESGNVLLEGVHKMSEQIDSTFAQQMHTQLPEQSRGWLLPFLVVVAGAIVKKL
mmetsp:Transcript_35308/g.56259  ORF Transcript_35308/g.56259 Transcript_35308/m.56259 type:complete len:250 (-) Transcript_35308:256-1005(-)